jgi:hypothetical protein
MPIRLIAQLISQSTEPKVKHFRGFPPELTDGKDNRVQMGRPSLLLIKEDTNGIFLYRFTSDGKCVGDTWHKSVEEAKSQAVFEFENSLSAWKPVPPEVEDAVLFGLASST